MQVKLEDEILKDISNHIKGIMINRHISFDSSKSDREIILAYRNVSSKFIVPRHRNVIYSKELQEKINNKCFLKDNIMVEEGQANDIIDLICYFDNIFLEGKDVNNHLSTQIFTSKRQDMLFNTWNVKHIHLNNVEVNSKSGMKKNRADFLLFCIVDKENVYFIDVREHPKGNEFSSFSFLEIIYNNRLMEKIGFYEIGHDYIPHSMKPQITDDKELYEMYNKLHINSGFDFEGHGFFNLGIASSGDKITHTLWLNKFVSKLRTINYSKNEYLGFKPQNNDYCVGKIEFQVGNDVKSFYINLENDE